MNVSDKTRRVVFEVAAILAIVVIPGTAILVSRMDSELAQNRLTLEELSGIQDERFAGDYLEIAGQVGANITELQHALTNWLQDGRFSAFAFRLRAAPFNQWLELQMAGSGGQRVQNQRLIDKIAKQSPVSDPGALAVSRDLGSLLKEVKTSYSNYLDAAGLVLTNAERAAKGESNVDAGPALNEVGQSAKQLLNLADEARRSGAAIESFLKIQKAKSPSPPILRYFLMAGLFGLFVFLLLAFRCFITSQLNLELAKKDLVIEHQHQLSHLGQLAAGLAHEIRNPLTAISARLYTLQKGLSDGSPEYNDSSVIRDEVRRLDKIVQDFLTLARPAAPKLVAMSADSFLQKLRDLLAPQYEPLAIELRVDSVTSTPFRADEQQLTQVLINLIRNAAESMQKNGKITLRARTAEEELRHRVRDVVVMEVEDTGPGIPPEVQERLFTPFFSTKETGTGLGLAIAARIINKHGGDLKFETQRNHGTVFRVVLPLDDQPS